MAESAEIASRISPRKMTSGSCRITCAQRVAVAVRVDADLALLDDRQHVVVHDLDGILDGDDVRAAGAVDVADHRGDRRGLAGARRPRDEDEAARRVGQRLHHRGQAQLFEARHLAPHAADREAHHPALAEDVDAEAADARHRVAEVGLGGGDELTPLVLGHEEGGEPLGVVGSEGVEGGGLELAVHADEGHVADLQMQVGRTPFHRVAQQLVDVHARPHASLTDVARRPLQVHRPRKGRT